MANLKKRKQELEDAREFKRARLERQRERDMLINPVRECDIHLTCKLADYMYAHIPRVLTHSLLKTIARPPLLTPRQARGAAQGDVFVFPQNFRATSGHRLQVSSHLSTPQSSSTPCLPPLLFRLLLLFNPLRSICFLLLALCLGVRRHTSKM